MAAVSLFCIASCTQFWFDNVVPKYSKFADFARIQWLSQCCDFVLRFVRSACTDTWPFSAFGAKPFSAAVCCLSQWFTFSPCKLTSSSAGVFSSVSLARVFLMAQPLQSAVAIGH